MDLKLFWTETARTHLEDISEYYKTKADKKAARKILINIYNKAIVLEKHPQIGQLEELLKGRKNKYRY